MPKRICPVCFHKVTQNKYGIGIPEGGSGWYFRPHYIAVGEECPASREDVAIVLKKWGSRLTKRAPDSLRAVANDEVSE